MTPRLLLRSAFVLTTCLVFLAATSLSASDLFEREAPFGRITVAYGAEVGNEVEVTVETTGSAISQPTDLVVDMHAILGAGERKAGLGQQRFALTPGKDEKFTAKFATPELAGISRTSFPVFLTPTGKNWAEKLAASEVETRMVPPGAPLPAKGAAPAPATASGSTKSELIEKQTPFGKISYPHHAEVGTEIPVTIQIRGQAISQPSDLVLDLHALVGAGKRQTGLGDARFPLNPGEDATHVAKFTAPDIAGISRAAMPIYVTARGKGWKEKTGSEEAQVFVVAKGATPPALKKAPPVQAIVADPLPIEQPPVEILSEKRAEMVLNGPWLFRPAGEGRTFEEIADDDWGQIWVPGSWAKPTRVVPGLIRTLEGGIWNNCTPDLVSAWYERKVTIPEDWKGRAIVLDLLRVSTEAIVYANGKECGVVSWPGGKVDITSAVEPGKEATLRIRVFAVETGGMEVVQMGTVAGDYMRAAKLDTRGIIGDVVLSSHPQGAYISDVLVIPSVTKQELTARAEIKDAQAGKATFTARLFDEAGKLEKTFEKEVELDGSPTQKVDLTWKWSDPRLWDIGQPNLYTLKLEAKGAGLDDEYADRFGFREFGIDGKNFVLNGRVVHLRPDIVGVAAHSGGGMKEITDNAVRTRLSQGINHMYIWPADPSKRGTLGYTVYDAWFRSADEAGMLMSAPAPWFEIRSPDRKIKDQITWSPEKRAAYKETVDRHLRPYRNHPSIVLWGGTANQFPLQHNENPRLLGRKNNLPPDLRDYTGRNVYTDLVKAADDAIAAFKELDPTRPFYCHHSSFVGEVSNFNTYLGLHQLQEREDWLSHYAEHGDMPYASHEFGMPIEIMFTRGRSGNYGRSLGSEPLLTEFVAIYLGPDSYAKECPDYHAQIRKDYKPNANQEAPYGKWARNFHLANHSPNHVEIMQLFTRNTWRSWRTWGMSGGLYPWFATNFSTPDMAGNVTFRVEKADTPVPMPPFQPGRRGPYLPTIPAGVLHSKDDKNGFIITPAGKTLLENNQPTIAWIAGSKEAFTEKDHHFLPGDTVEKQIVIINDQITPDPAYSATWSVEIDGKRIDGGEFKGTVASGDKVMLPFSFKTVGTAPKTEGVIKLEATVGDTKHVDEFPFRVYAKPAPGAVNNVAVIDPESTTSTWLKSLGYQVSEWDGGNVPLVIVGRNALSGETKSPKQVELDAYIRAGGHVLVLNQDRAWTKDQVKFRTAPVVSRRAWPVEKDHPVTTGLDGDDFRDWRGAGTAFPEELKTEIAPNQGHPDHGWHWGNRGSVATAIPELPHFSTTRPILQAEFDLVYSPLMETRVGKGAIIWCSLDLEGRTEADPVADIVTRRLIDYAATVKLPPARPVAYIGDESGKALLTLLGVPTVAPEPGSDQLIVAGPGADEAALQPFTEKGNPILVLPRQTQRAPFGVELKKVTMFGGSKNVPDWPEARGLSIPDVRFRTLSENPWWVISGGCDIGADGLLGRKQVGKSTVIYCQLDPAWLNADKLPYFRYTRWRQHRAIANLLGNLGAEFQADTRFAKAIAGKQPGTPAIYHPNYIVDFVQGDDPYRWNTW